MTSAVWPRKIPFWAAEQQQFEGCHRFVPSRGTGDSQRVAGGYFHKIDLRQYLQEQLISRNGGLRGFRLSVRQYLTS